MRLVLWSDAIGFLERAEPFLLADEARHHLTFGIALGLRAGHPVQVGTGAPFLATVEDRGRVVATAAHTGFNLILSPSAEVDFAGSPVLDELAEIVEVEIPHLPGVLAPPAISRAFADAWTRRTGQPWRLGRRERTHALTSVRPLDLPPGRLRMATMADRALIVPWLREMHSAIGLDEPFDPEAAADRRLAPPEAPGDPYRSLYLWIDEDGEPRSMAGAQATTATGVRIGAVYTPVEHRRRGYATATVASLSHAMLDRGRQACYLFTDLANPTSNRIYATIGYEPVCDLDDIRFGRET